MTVYELIRELVKCEPGTEIYVQRTSQKREMRILSVSRPEILWRRADIGDKARIRLLTDWSDDE